MCVLNENLSYQCYIFEEVYKVFFSEMLFWIVFQALSIFLKNIKIINVEYLQKFINMFYYKKCFFLKWVLPKCLPIIDSYSLPHNCVKFKNKIKIKAKLHFILIT